MRLANEQVFNAIVLIAADHQHGPPVQWMERISDHRFECRNPGSMASARMTAPKIGPSSRRSSKQPYAARGISSPGGIDSQTKRHRPASLARRCPHPSGQSLARQSPRRTSALDLGGRAPATAARCLTCPRASHLRRHIKTKLKGCRSVAHLSLGARG